MTALIAVTPLTDAELWSLVATEVETRTELSAIETESFDARETDEPLSLKKYRKLGELHTRMRLITMAKVRLAEKESK